jgi:hypothetical protein
VSFYWILFVLINSILDAICIIIWCRCITPCRVCQDMVFCMEALYILKLQYRRFLFDIKLYLAEHKSLVSTSLNIIHRGCTFHVAIDSY